VDSVQNEEQPVERICYQSIRHEEGDEEVQVPPPLLFSVMWMLLDLFPPAGFSVSRVTGIEQFLRNCYRNCH